MTRMPRDENGKPLPTPARPDDFTFEEPTVKRAVPSAEELDAHLAQVAGAGQGEWPTTYRKGPL